MLMGVAAQLGFGALDRCWLKEVLAERIEDQTKSCSGLREMTIERQSGDWGFDGLEARMWRQTGQRLGWQRRLHSHAL
jgi:hypothetical protein